MVGLEQSGRLTSDDSISILMRNALALVSCIVSVEEAQAY